MNNTEDNRHVRSINRLQVPNLKQCFLFAMTSFCLVVGQVSYAKTIEVDIKNITPKFEDWRVTSAGGLKIIHPKNDCFSIAVGGVVRSDLVIFTGSARDKSPYTAFNPITITSPFFAPVGALNGFPSGANIRTAEVQVSGAIGDRFNYMVDVLLHTNPVSFNDTYLNYKVIPGHFDVAVGRLAGNYSGLENAYGTTWMPFMERSIHAQAFYPGDGLGARAEIWGKNAAVKAVLLQIPDQGSPLPVNSAGTTVFGRDRMVATLRATYAPVHDFGNVWHFGISGVYRQSFSNYQALPAAGVRFSCNPGLRNRINSRSLDTGGIAANYDFLYSVEFRRQICAFTFEANHSNMFVHRVGDPRGQLNFDGWLLQARYTLTGEVHEYDVKDGAIGGFKPHQADGAWEVAVRYDVLNLNDKNVQGGDEHNLAFALNWYINEQVRLSANFIHANIMAPNTATKRYLDMYGFRAQVRFK